MGSQGQPAEGETRGWKDGRRRFRRRGLWFAVPAAFATVLIAGPAASYFDRLWPGAFGLAQSNPVERLAKLEADLAQRFPEIGHLDSSMLADSLPLKAPQSAAGDGGTDIRENPLQKSAIAPELAGKVVIFDVRERAEFEVSHIPGAIQVDPDLTAREFLSRFKSVLDRPAAGQSGPTSVVFYCSVGVRSSKLASRVHKAGGDALRGRLHNLRGGIFRWHNESRDLVGPDGAGEGMVHGYDAYWSRFLTRSDNVIY